MKVIIVKCAACNWMLSAQYNSVGSFLNHCINPLCHLYFGPQRGELITVQGQSAGELPKDNDIERKVDACKQHKKAILENEQKINVVMCKQCEGPVGVSDAIVIADDICKGHRINHGDLHHCYLSVVPFTVGSC